MLGNRTIKQIGRKKALIERNFAIHSEESICEKQTIMSSLNIQKE